MLSKKQLFKIIVAKARSSGSTGKKKKKGVLCPVNKEIEPCN
jgi:hypothetical protein